MSLSFITSSPTRPLLLWISRWFKNLDNLNASNFRNISASATSADDQEWLTRYREIIKPLKSSLADIFLLSFEHEHPRKRVSDEISRTSSAKKRNAAVHVRPRLPIASSRLPSSMLLSSGLPATRRGNMPRMLANSQSESSAACTSPQPLRSSKWLDWLRLYFNLCTVSDLDVSSRVG